MLAKIVKNKDLHIIVPCKNVIFGALVYKKEEKMTEAVKIVTFINILFIILLMVSGTVGGIVGEIVYYLAFFAPIAVGFYSAKGLKYKREEIAGVAEQRERFLDFRRDDIKTLLPLIAPTVMTVFTVSLITSLFLSLFGVKSPPVEEKGLVTMLLVNALVPAVLEEALFRYIPMKLLLPYSKRLCVIYSALYFALIHCSFSKMPYAFIAGTAFMIINISIGSVWPSLVLHFLNNVASVIWIKYCSGLFASVMFISILAALTIVSAVFIYKNHRAYRDLFCGALDKGEAVRNTYAPLALILITCYIASVNIFT